MYTSCSQGSLHQGHRSAYRFRFFSFRIRCSESQSYGRWKTTHWMGIPGVWSETRRRKKGYSEARGVWMCLRVLSWKPRGILYIPWNNSAVGELGPVHQYRSTDGSRSQIVRLIFPLHLGIVQCNSLIMTLLIGFFLLDLYFLVRASSIPICRLL